MKLFLYRLLVNNLGLKIVSLAAAVGLWALIATEPEMETSIVAPAEFHNAPSRLELVSDQHPEVYLHVRGPSSRVRGLTRADVAVVVDLAGVRQPGDRIFRLDSSQVVLPRGVSLVRANPSQLLLKFENRLTRAVNVLPRFTGAYTSGYAIAKYEVHPPSLQVVGPESRVAPLDYVSTGPVDLSRLIGSATFTAHAYLPDPLLRFENLESVRVTVEMRKP